MIYFIIDKTIPQIRITRTTIRIISFCISKLPDTIGNKETTLFSDII